MPAGPGQHERLLTVARRLHAGRALRLECFAPEPLTMAAFAARAGISPPGPGLAIVDHSDARTLLSQ